MRTTEIENALKPLSILNSWARGTGAQRLDFDCNAAVYDMKRRVILAALEAGVCTWRIVQVERHCLACKGTGTYIWTNWYDEYDQHYEDCRRCRTKGTVVLRFFEADILGTKFHTPSNKASWLSHLNIDWEKAQETDWTPQQPGRVLGVREIIRCLNETERAIFGDKILRWNAGWRGSVYDYSLNFGRIAECFVCGRFHVGPSPGYDPRHYAEIYGEHIHRPGMTWRQTLCRSCEGRAERWPRQWPASLYPERWVRSRWITESPKWPMNVPFPREAESDHVQEWLRRRGIEIGAPVPAEYYYLQNVSVNVVAVRDGRALYQIADSQDWRYITVASEAPMLWAPVDHFSALPRKLIPQGRVSRHE